MSKALSVAMSPHFRAGQDYERERIIALLESELQPATDENDFENYLISSLIALIKGENK